MVIEYRPLYKRTFSKTYITESFRPAAGQCSDPCTWNTAQPGLSVPLHNDESEESSKASGLPMPSSPSPPTLPSPLPTPPPNDQILTVPPDQPVQAKVGFLAKNQDARRPSVQFVTHHAEATLRSASPKPGRPKVQSQRLSSPPPPS